MCSYIVEKAKLIGSAKGPNGWMKVDTANVYYDHPFHAPLDHALGIDFICEADGGRERVAVELSRESALALIGAIQRAALCLLWVVSNRNLATQINVQQVWRHKIVCANALWLCLIRLSALLIFIIQLWKLCRN